MRDLTGKTVVITSGPTFAPIDAVRAITNRSTGRLGSTIAYTLMQRGARILFLAGETSLTPALLYPGEDVSSIILGRFTTVPQLRDQLRKTLMSHPVDVVIMAAAVLDYLPVAVQEGKKRSSEDEWVIRLQRGEKIIEQIRDWAPDVFLVGFKLEARISLEELIERSDDLMRRSGAGLVVANRIEDISSERHVAYLIEPGSRSDPGRVSEPLETRERIAQSLADRLALRLK